jgi:hypothetical protein
VNLSDIQQPPKGLRLSDLSPAPDRAPEANPETSIASALWNGLVQGAGNIGMGAARLGARMRGGGLEYLDADTQQGVIGAADRMARERQQTFERSPEARQHPIASTIGQMGGEMAAIAPLMALPGGQSVPAAALWSALTGAVGGALGAASSAPADSFGRSVATGAGLGAGMGGALGGAGAMLRPPVLGARRAPVAPPVAPAAAGPAIGPQFPPGARMATVQPGSGPGPIVQSPRGMPPVTPAAPPVAVTPRPPPVPEPKSWTEAARMLAQKDVRLSPGQAHNMSEMERNLQSLPILRGFVRGQVGRSVDDFDRAVVRQSLDDIGAAVPRTVRAGHELMEFATKRFDEAYTPLLPHITLNREGVARVLQADPEVSMLMSEMAQDDARRLASIIENRVLAPRLWDNGVMTGQTFKQVERDLSRRADGFAGGRDDDLAKAIRRTLSTLRDEVANQNPQFGPELQKINRSFSLFAEARAAAARDADGRGKFTPHDLLQTIKHGSSESSFARGIAPLQAFAEAGQEVIGPSITSRTPEMSRSAARIAADIIGGAAATPLYLGAMGAQAIPGLGRGVGALAPGAAAETARRQSRDRRREEPRTSIGGP